MALAARLGALTDELIEVIVAQSNPARLGALRDASLQNLRHHNFLRTNQFDVEDQLNGLEERFRVLNRDRLADALRENLDVLSSVSNKFTPEVLHFLLELADQPVSKSRLEDLGILRQPAEDPSLPLKWEEVAEEDDGAGDRDLWKQVDFRGDSSEDDFIDNHSDVSDRSEGTSLSSIEAQYRRRPTDLVVTPQDTNTLEIVRESQAWRLTPEESSEPDAKTTISELQAVREVLFMLRGLRNDLFNADCRSSTRYKLQNVSWKSFQALLSQWGEFGRNIEVSRRFAQKDQQTPLLQVFRSTVEKQLRTLDRRLAAIEADLVDLKKDTVVSLMRVAEDLRPRLQTLCSLSQVIQKLEKENYPHPFRYLELLFELITIAQLGGDGSLYESLGTLFFECFQVYLRPIRQWMQDGVLSANDKTFFVTELQSHLPLSQVWEGQFALRRSPDGVLHAPSFLQPAVEKIFTTGKSVVVLKHIGKHETHETLENNIAEPLLDFESLVTFGVGNFAPFSEVFDSGFEGWMQSKHHSASAKLRRVLFDSCGLQSVLSDLYHFYLMVDGSRLDDFARSLFNNLDLLNDNWHDRFLLTQSFQDAFGAVTNAHRIVVSAAGCLHQDTVVIRKSVRDCLPAVSLNYRMSWPIRIIISDESMTHYQAVFTLLLQTHRAVDMLQKQRFLSKGLFDLTSGQAVYYGLRSRLLWFFGCLKSYLSNIVIAPLIAQFQEELDRSPDVDSMASIHSAFAKHIRDASCLSSKLGPIRESMLGIMDIAILLEDAHRAEVERQTSETQELSRLSVPVPARPQNKRAEKYTHITEEEDNSFLGEQDSGNNEPSDMPYDKLLSGFRAQFDRQLRFICGGLRGAARASKEAAASKWDVLAEMLEIGVNQNEW
ncbi:gamma-tubulin complex component (Spc97/Spc98 family protein) [Seiridium cupressi]